MESLLGMYRERGSKMNRVSWFHRMNTKWYRALKDVTQKTGVVVPPVWQSLAGDGERLSCRSGDTRNLENTDLEKVLLFGDGPKKHWRAVTLRF